MIGGIEKLTQHYELDESKVSDLADKLLYLLDHYHRRRNDITSASTPYNDEQPGDSRDARLTILKNKVIKAHLSDRSIERIDALYLRYKQREAETGDVEAFTASQVLFDIIALSFQGGRKEGKRKKPSQVFSFLKRIQENYALVSRLNLAGIAYRETNSIEDFQEKVDYFFKNLDQ